MNKKMEILKDKKILIGVGVLVALGVAYYAMKKKNEVVASDSVAKGNGVVPKNNYTITLGSSDVNGSTWQVIDGKKYPIYGTNALIKFGLNPKDYPFEVVSKETLDSIPDGGYIDETGIVKK